MIERLARAAVNRACERLIAAAADELPELRAERTDAGVRLSGRGIGRLIGDARLRGLAWRARP